MTSGLYVDDLKLHRPRLKKELHLLAVTLSANLGNGTGREVEVFTAPIGSEGLARPLEILAAGDHGPWIAAKVALVETDADSEQLAARIDSLRGAIAKTRLAGLLATGERLGTVASVGSASVLAGEALALVTDRLRRAGDDVILEAEIKSAVAGEEKFLPFRAFEPDNGRATLYARIAEGLEQKEAPEAQQQTAADPAAGKEEATEAATEAAPASTEGSATGSAPSALSASDGTPIGEHVGPGGEIAEPPSAEELELAAADSAAEGTVEPEAVDGAEGGNRKRRRG